ncbi:MAG: NUDIX hydrolase [Actinobacteria bacterium]|nr:NUDIX hydrolase [Actinomycetota bacterium]
MASLKSEFTVHERAAVRNHVSAPPRRRLGVAGIMLDEEGRVLLCEKPLNQKGPVPLYHPGGVLESNEDMRAGLSRHIQATLGLDITPGRLLAVHHMPQEMCFWFDVDDSYLAKEVITYVFDCGTVAADTKLMLGPGIAEAHWFELEALDKNLLPFMAARTGSALRALGGGDVELLTGHPLWR